MSHSVYNTDAIVLSRADTADADMILWLLTKELGLVVARAQGARKEAGKMRNHLQALNVLSISMVRGKHMWRVTGAEALSSGASRLGVASLPVFAKMAEFVRRMTVPDQAVDLYSLVLNVREQLTDCTDVKQLETIELLTVAKILISLGYMNKDTLNKDNVSKRGLMSDVNKAIAESHL